MEIVAAQAGREVDKAIFPSLAEVEFRDGDDSDDVDPRQSFRAMKMATRQFAPGMSRRRAPSG